jgi:hypothetical protein
MTDHTDIEPFGINRAILAQIPDFSLPMTLIQKLALHFLIKRFIMPV